MNARERYDSLFKFYSEPFGIDWRLLKAQAIAESGLNANAISPVGAKGLAQFMPATFVEWWDKVWGVKGIPKGDPTNPESSISLQAAYMSSLLKAFSGQSDAAFAAYNWGWGRMNKHIQKYGKLTVAALRKETSDYIIRINRIYVQLKG